MFNTTTIVPSCYYDSVVLMRVASQLKKRAGVAEVAMFMGTEGNHALLGQAGLATGKSQEAGSQDLIIIVRAETEPLAVEITQEAKQLLTARRASNDSTLNYRPRTLERALQSLPAASLAAISVPGTYAAREAGKCIDQGLNVFLFSDNVAVEDEVALKAKAVGRNLLFMGPDCGTAYLNGVGLGFTNVVRRGRIGCVAASGTGLQAVVCRIDQLGEGISHGIGVGGRDLKLEVGGIMTIFALELLEQDAETEVIVLLSKPPHPTVAEKLEKLCRTMKTPVIACFQGTRLPSDALEQAETLDEAAHRAICRLHGEAFIRKGFEQPAKVADLLNQAGPLTGGRLLLGLYTGGTLAKEACQLLAPVIGDIAAEPTATGSHMVLDLGDDRYTIGKPHPMIAPENRTEMLLELAGKSKLDNCGVLLFDVVLGNGSHLDPATELIHGLKELQLRPQQQIPAVAALIGTDKDPQSLAEQQSKLEDAGIAVFRDHSEAVRYAAMLIDPAYRTLLMEELS
jgi:FdrA protein